MSVMSVMSELALLSMILSLVIPVSTPQSLLAQQRPAAANSTTYGTTSTNLQIYSNPMFGIKMQYPSNWLKQDLTHNSSSDVFVLFKIPADKPLGLLSISGVNHKSSNVTLDNLVRLRENQLNHTGNILQVNSSAPATLSGDPARKIIFTTISPQGIKFDAMQLISVVGNKSYFITYAAPAAYYATYLPTIQTILSLIEINRMACK
jgi:hypothetical protein